MRLLYMLLAALLAAGTDAFDWDEPTALDDYVNFDDGYFSWEILDTYRFEENKTTVYMLNMTSQKWMDETLTSRPIWFHMMGVAIPDVIQHDLAYMWIDGGSNGGGSGPEPPDDEKVLMIVELAERTGCVGAYIRQVPNQSMVFTNDPNQEERSEDAIIAWTWYTFIKSHLDQPEVILRMPMTKAAKRGHDAIDELVQSVSGHEITRFIPGGGSKRGWTTWSVAATDPRVVAANPVVMSLLNFNDTLQAHYRNLDEAWSIAFIDYYKVNLTMHIHDDEVVGPGGLWDYEDMFRYKERLGEIPKLMISAAGDEFFLLTDSHNWWSQMPGKKWIMMVPNAEHSLAPWYLKVAGSVISFIMSIVEKVEFPSLSWFRMDTPTGGLLRFSTDIPPNNISAWQAFTWENDTRKDFRLLVGYPPFIHPVMWHRIPFEDLGEGHYVVEVERPELGFTGIFFEAKWNYITQDWFELCLTSEVHVSPETFPGDPCYGVECHGHLV